MARKISECRQQMHLLENEKSIRNLLDNEIQKYS